MKFIIGKKIEMAQSFDDDGRVTPVTKITAGPCFVVAKNAGNKVALAYGAVKKMNKPTAGFFKKALAKDGGYKFIKEFKVLKADELEKIVLGQEINVANFNVGEIAQVQGVSKGKGFQGIVKRHHFRGGKKSHGHKDQLRMPGSAGAKGVAHVVKGKRMAGRMGGNVVSVKNLKIVQIAPDKNEIWVKGAVPGFRGSLVYLTVKE